jgi:hypothetical protein
MLWFLLVILIAVAIVGGLAFSPLLWLVLVIVALVLVFGRARL